MSAILSTFHAGLIGALGSVLEISLIVLLTYFAIRAMRGTRGAGVARGAMILFVFLFIILLFTARLVQLENIRWILENLVGVSLLGIVVIFQPEIRRALIRIGESALHFYGGKTGAFEKELADAAFQISNRGEVGSLFVIERKTQIGGYIESGVSIDAQVTAKLLVTIFTKNTPLHDGAVIIRQGRIVAANCLLPLSENIEICRGMGTRHRAAIGLTEEADSLVVIVSEETGKVSLAMNGQMESGLDYDTLLSLLHDHIHEDDIVDDPSARTEDA